MLSTAVIVLAAILVFHHAASAQSDCSPCGNPRGMDGVCQKLTSCEPLVQLLCQYGNKVSEFMRQSLCFFDGMDPHVCCPTTITNDIKPVTPTSSYGPLLPPICGTTGDMYLQVVGGKPAKLGEWPWMAAFGYRRLPNTPKKVRWRCGGSLISARHVLTAAHCIYKHNDLYVVRVGDLNLADDDDGATPIDSSIVKRTIHPQYNPTHHTNDIGVLRLQIEVEFTQLIRPPLCLPFTDGVRRTDLTGAFPFIVGVAHLSGPSSPLLQKVQVPIVSQDRCRKAYRNFSAAIIDDRVLCAGYPKGGKDACTGDSGGPLIYKIGSYFYALGVVSYGFKCAEPDFPGIYTKTASYLDFIIPLLK